MTRIAVHNRNHPLQNELQVRYCEGFFQRFLGLMFHPPMTNDDGVLLVQTRENRKDSAIHMLFMRMDLAVIWINSKLEVVDKSLAKKWRPFYIPKQPACYVLECCPSRLSDFNLGDVVEFEKLTVEGR